MAVIGERLDHVGAGAHELAVELAHRLGGVEHHLRHVRPGLEVAAPLQLEQITLGADHWPLGQPLQQSFPGHCALPCLLWRVGWPRGGGRCQSQAARAVWEPPDRFVRCAGAGSGRVHAPPAASPRFAQFRHGSRRGKLARLRQGPRRRRPPTSLSPGRSVRRSWCCPHPISATDLIPSSSPSMAEPTRTPRPAIISVSRPRRRRQRSSSIRPACATRRAGSPGPIPAIRRARCATLRCSTPSSATSPSAICVDLDAVFVVGHSLGASFANSLACARGGQVRAVGSVAGGIDGTACTGRAAALLLHNPADRAVPISEGLRARDALLGDAAAGAATVDAPTRRLRLRGLLGRLGADPVVSLSRQLHTDRALLSSPMARRRRSSDHPLLSRIGGLNMRRLVCAIAWCSADRTHHGGRRTWSCG